MQDSREEGFCISQVPFEGTAQFGIAWNKHVEEYDIDM